MGINQYCWPPITGAGNRCQNMCLKAQAAKPHATLFRTRSTATPRDATIRQPSQFGCSSCINLFSSSYVTRHILLFFIHHLIIRLTHSVTVSTFIYFFENKFKNFSLNTCSCCLVAFVLHAFSGAAFLLIVVQFSPSTALITIPQPLLPSYYLLPSQQPRTAFHVSVFWNALDRDHRLALRSQIRRVVCFLVVSSENVLQMIANIPDRMRDALLQPRVQCFLYSVTHISLLLSHRAVPICPLSGNVAVAAQVHCNAFTAQCDHVVWRLQLPCFSVFVRFEALSNFRPVYDRVLYAHHDKGHRIRHVRFANISFLL